MESAQITWYKSPSRIQGEERNDMRRNNPAGKIPTKRPILNRMKDAVMEIYLGLSEEEMKSLQAEIRSATETNCDYKIYDIAQMLKNSVDISVNGI